MRLARNFWVEPLDATILAPPAPTSIRDACSTQFSLALSRGDIKSWTRFQR